MEAPIDGIFRALPAPASPGVAPAGPNRWAAVLSLAGEAYQAYFETQEDAAEAVAAAAVVA
jgi:hypothetical protein